MRILLLESIVAGLKQKIKISVKSEIGGVSAHAAASEERKLNDFLFNI